MLAVGYVKPGDIAISLDQGQVGYKIADVAAFAVLVGPTRGNNAEYMVEAAAEQFQVLCQVFPISSYELPHVLKKMLE